MLCYGKQRPALAAAVLLAVSGAAAPERPARYALADAAAGGVGEERQAQLPAAQGRAGAVAGFVAGASAGDAGELPKSIGILGVGTIGSALARGVLGSPSGHLPGGFVPDFVLSPRNAEKAAALKAEFPTSVHIADDNQGVVDGADCVVLALPTTVAEDVLRSLRFREGQKVISLISGLSLPRLQELLGSSVDCARAVPLPAIAMRQGTTIGFPARPFAQAIFAVTGTFIAAADEDELTTMSAVCALMGDLYKRQLTVQQWLMAHGTAPEKAAAYVGAMFSTMVAASAAAGPSTFQALVAEQTPGGVNEMVWKQQEAAGAYALLNRSLDAVHRRQAPHHPHHEGAAVPAAAAGPAGGALAQVV